MDETLPRNSGKEIENADHNHLQTIQVARMNPKNQFVQKIISQMVGSQDYEIKINHICMFYSCSNIRLLWDKNAGT